LNVFTNFKGQLRCVRCAAVSDAVIQTYLFRTTAENAGREYRVGDSEAVDGLEEFYPLHPRDHRSRIVLGVGDWACDHCSLNWQWARVTLDLSRRGDELSGTVTAVDALMPWTPAALEGVHRVEPDLAELSTFPARPLIDRREWLGEWAAKPVATRCSAIASGFREWCREVAGVSAPA
jgi:hypothetical protein